MLNESMLRILDEQLSLSEGILTEEHLDEYVSGICDVLEENGYEVYEEFDLQQFLEEVAEIVEGDENLDEGVKDWLNKAGSAVKGAISRGMPAGIKKRMFQHHDAQASAALDRDDREGFARHYRKSLSYPSQRIRSPDTPTVP